MDNIHETLSECRAQIDDIDRQLIICLARRFQLSQDIGLLKRSAEVSVYQSDRAKEVQDRYINLGLAHGIHKEFVVDLFQLIHEESCRIQSEDATTPTAE